MNGAAGVAIDVLLAAGLVWMAAWVLFSRDLVRAGVLFVVFGLVLALTWVRLAAIDLALAEAAIGAGLLGALVIDAAHQLRRRDSARGRER